MVGALWTPDRDIPLDDTKRNVKSIDPREMTVVRAMDTIGRKHNIVLACEQCRQPFQGLNDGNSAVEAIFCGCRELRAVRRIIS